jgi:hypothetical protein
LNGGDGGGGDGRGGSTHGWWMRRFKCGGVRDGSSERACGTRFMLGMPPLCSRRVITYKGVVI